MPDLSLYRTLNFMKNERGSSNFRKIRAIVPKYTKIYYIDQGTLVLNLTKIASSVQIFLRF